MGSFNWKLLLLSILTLSLFIIFSYTVAKRDWQQVDFDTTVKLQDHISRRFDKYFSYFSILGSVEVTVAIAGILAFLNLIRLKILNVLGWLLIIPASMVEVFGKLVVFHPAPQDFLHRNVLIASLPSFNVHTNFSYPSGHMARTFFLITTMVVILLFQKKYSALKLPTIFGLVLYGLLMSLTRIYLGEHWLSDVIGGSILGISVGLLAAFLMVREKRLS